MSVQPILVFGDPRLEAENRPVESFDDGLQELVDDLFVVCAALSRLLNHVHPDVVRSAWSGKGDALAAIQGVSSWAEALVSGRLRALLRGVLGTHGATR